MTESSPQKFSLSPFWEKRAAAWRRASEVVAKTPPEKIPALVAVFALFAWFARGVHEDGFFFLRVVDVFLRGGGLAYNPGERFETNTDFLWTLLLVPGPAAGMDDILWMHIAGVVVYAGALWATFVLARKLFSDSDAALAALVLLGTHYTFTHFAATGFGAVLQALAAVCCLLALWRFGEKTDFRNGAVLGAALSFLALCRLDSAIFGAPVVLCAMLFAWRVGKPALSGIAAALAIPAAVSGALLFWKWSYYGDIFPATYYTKGALSQAGIDDSAFKVRRGVFYVAEYWKRYFLWLLAAAAAFGAWRMSGRKQKGGDENGGRRTALLRTAAAMCVLWHLYMLRIGGGYAEFRFMSAQAPMMMLLLAWGFSGLARHWRWAAVCAAGFFSLLHWATASGRLTPGVERAKTMVHTRLVWDGGVRTEIYTPRGFVNHRLLGEGLAELFAPLGAYPPEVKVASPAGGVPAYLAKLRWVEMHGYADARISRADAPDLWRFPDEELVGHRILARPKWLARRGVNLVADTGAYPRRKDRKEQAKLDADPNHAYPRPDFFAPISGAANPRLWWAAKASGSPAGADLELPPDSQLFALPLPDRRAVPVLYFNRNTVIDKALDDREIERVNVFD